MCHSHVAADDISFSNASLHIDGTVQASGGDCSGCHSGITNFPPTSGAHTKHYNHLTNDIGLTPGSSTGALGDWNDANYPVCSTCHDMTNPGTNHTGVTDYTMGVNKTSLEFDNSGTPPSYDPAPLLQSCSNVNCHFKSTPDWQP
jgi:hypothetical protein